MIKSREELVKCANEWLGVARNDLRRKMTEFIENVGASNNEIAHILAISNSELQNILNGNVNISLDTFAKLLIATGNAIEIKPISQTPLKSHRRSPSASANTRQRMPMPGAMPMPPFMRNGGMPIPPPHEFGQMPMGEEQNQDEMTPIAPLGVRKIRVSRRELVDAIIENSLDDEIDLVNSTTDELARFLQHKGVRFGKEAKRQAERPQCTRQQETENRDARTNEFDEIAKMMAEELRNRPDLMNQVKKYFQ